MLLVDDLAPSGGTEPTLRWNGYEEREGDTSVSLYLERRGDALRRRYLAFVHELGEVRVGDRPLREHFRTADGFSFWWMNRIAEKSPFKSARIFDCLRVLALEELLVERAAQSLTLHSTDDDLGDAVAELCRARGIRYARVGRRRRRRSFSLRTWYDALPHWVRGLLSLRHLVWRWRFRTIRPVRWNSGDSAIFACSYLYNLDPHAAREGRFKPRQWEALPGWLASRGVPLNWLHHYLPDVMPVSDSVALLQQLNASPPGAGRHAVLESYLTLPSLGRILVCWLRGIRMARRARSVPAAFRPDGSAAWLWPLLRDDWRNSTSGTSAVSNCVWYVLFDAALGDLSSQRRGVYLYEGQGWETAFLHHWRKHGHGEAIAVPHSSMPFWYLNIYDDPRSVTPMAAGGKPHPDRWALNGPMAWDAFVAAGYPQSRLAPVEALRYQYLLTLPVRGAVRERGDAASAPLRLLVLGDYTGAQTLHMLAAVREAATHIHRPLTVTVKLHPACHILPADVAPFTCEFTTAPLGDILGGFDAAFTSNTTSAGLDALLAGVPLVVFLDDEVLNHSPLRGVEGVTFASGGAALAAALAVPQRRSSIVSPGRFFWLDNALPRWSALLDPDAGLLPHQDRAPVTDAE